MLNKWYNRNDKSYKWSMHRVTTWYKSIKGDFSAGGNEKVFGCWLRFSPISRVSHKALGEGVQSKPGGCNKATSKEGEISGK